jgi:hypothetical protein
MGHEHTFSAFKLVFKISIWKRSVLIEKSHHTPGGYCWGGVENYSCGSLACNISAYFGALCKHYVLGRAPCVFNYV